MTDETIDQRRERMRREALELEANPTAVRYLYWLSFVDVDREPHQFLGVCVVEAASMIGAVLWSHALKCNPGGQVGSLELPYGCIDEKWHNRLLTKDEAEQVPGGPA